MMPRWLGALFLIGVGAAVLAIAYRGWRSGELPAGARGFVAAYRPSRRQNPHAFVFFLILYFCAGLALCVWGLLAILGMAPALKWR